MLLGVKDGRKSFENSATGSDLSIVRKAFYSLYSGSWHLPIADIGDIKMGETVHDTYYALVSVLTDLLKLQVIPIVIGGGHDLTYPMYRAYDKMDQMVNLVTVDHSFDVGFNADETDARSFLSKIIMNQPQNLFNYTNLGYQTYLNSQSEIDLMEDMLFEAYRLGLAKNMKDVEPVLRDADLVSVDMSVVKSADFPAHAIGNPNGFGGDEICAIARYAGISDKVTAFGLFEYNPVFDIKNQGALLMAQTIWYFIEGVNQRSMDYPFCSRKDYLKYIIPNESEGDLVFYKSPKSGRWWMEISAVSNTKYKRHTLIPCTHKDYLDAADQKITERWIKALRKMN